MPRVSLTRDRSLARCVSNNGVAADETISTFDRWGEGSRDGDDRAGGVRGDGGAAAGAAGDAGGRRWGSSGWGTRGCRWRSAFAEAGLPTIGVDLRPDRLAALAAGRSYVGDIADATVAALVASGRLRATDDYAALADADAITICVPTPLSKTKAPDIAAIVGAIGALAPHLRPGQLVVLESTSYPGTTEEILQPGDRGARPGRRARMSSSPSPRSGSTRATPRFGTRNTPKLVGGVTAACRDLAVALYRTIVDEVVPVSSPIVAETAKLLENTFRAVNVALANEMALMCQQLGVDVWEVIAAAATKPFGFMPFYPGPGLGGHCIPIVPHYLAWKLKTLGYEARFIALADEVNAAMPAHVVGAGRRRAERRRQGRCAGRGCCCWGSPTSRMWPTCASRRRWRCCGCCARRGPTRPTTTRSSRTWNWRANCSRAPRWTRRRCAAADCVVIATAPPGLRLGLGRPARARHRRHPQRPRRRPDGRPRRQALRCHGDNRIVRCFRTGEYAGPGTSRPPAGPTCDCSSL